MKMLMVALGALLALPVLGQQKDSLSNLQEKPNELKEIMIHGNRIQVPFSQVTRDIQVITKEEIAQFPAKSLHEVLSYISGVDIRQRGPFGTQADLSIDGGTSEQTLLLINGVKMIDAQSAHNMMNVPIPLSAIDHIEVIRGAAARVFGINALTGAINIVTKKENHSSIVADIQAGSSFKSKNKNDGSGIYGGGSVELTGNFGTENQSHLFSIAQSLYNGQRYNSGSNNTQLFYAGNYDFDAHHSVQAMAGYAGSSFGANGFYAAPGDRNSEEHVESSVFSLSSKHRWNNLTISPRISDRYGEDDYRYYKDDLSKGRSLHYTNALMLELNSTLETSIGNFGFGWESRFGKISSSNMGKHERDNHGAYAELGAGLGERLKGNLGVYANYNSDYGWQIYPGLDLAYLISDHWKFSASIGSGQRIPSFTDLYLDQRPGNVGNEFIKPESAWNYEGNFQYHKLRVSFKAGYFFRNITDFIDWIREDSSQPYSPVNFGSNQVQGVYGRIQQGFELGNQGVIGYRVSYNYLHPTLKVSAESQSKYALESMKHQLIVGINYTKNKFSTQLDNRLIERELGNAYLVSDVRVNYQFEKLQIYTQATNIFNTAYSEVAAVPMPTSWFSLGIKYHWSQI